MINYSIEEYKKKAEGRRGKKKKEEGEEGKRRRK